ncbi:minor capsid protein [Adlercreutzia equolifaciens]|uniref:Minor capsid protein n=1 Tax=Adlercreutzia equolifaciens TaxID=446660 RepID=A0A6L8Q6C9_9ACTN|nr:MULTISPECIES: putative minor capsid protein [Adlercreutzia]MCB6760063.1 minor capsid protein [Adlercreutzia equolifaciens]MCB6975718.1 minor capsid protein [Adlercreutzia equolifaciens]MCQ5070802.1 minor capsid protein [Adlercreutzia sp. DFI.6.23]MDE8683862.1 putative minor capsid protein [Adlercreutzia rubneri]MZG28850.1 minor capsid protein [Adlercreutzia equolifaciens]
MIPLPRRMLRQTATVRVPKDGPYGGEYEEAQTIERVWFDASATIRQTDYQLQAPVRGTLFIDPNTSAGAFAIPAGSLVSVDGEVSEATVHECSPIKDGRGRVHHWEVVLK